MVCSCYSAELEPLLWTLVTNSSTATETLLQHYVTHALIQGWYQEGCMAARLPTEPPSQLQRGWICEGNQKDYLGEVTAF